MFIIITIILFFFYGIERNIHDLTEDHENLCITPYCINAANYLLEGMNQTIDPCEDFFEFTCGAWLKKTKIPDDASIQNHFRILGEQLERNIVELLSTSTMDDDNNNDNELPAIVNSRRLYNSCLDEDQIEREGIKSILNLINTEFGGWPILDGFKWNNSAFDFTRLLLKLNEYNHFAIYAIATYTNEKNSSINGIRLNQGTLGLGDRSYYISADNSSAIAYQNYIRDFARALNYDRPINNTDVTAIFEFERELSKSHWTPTEQNTRSSETIYTTLSNLKSKLNATFNFDNYLRRLYLLDNITLVDTDLITVNEPDFFRHASFLISQQSSRTIQNYMIWRFLMNQAKNMPKKYRDIKQIFIQAFQGIITEPSRNTTCAIYVNDNMGLAVSKLYIRKYFDADARNQSLEMIEYIRETFMNMINQSTWMDSQAKIKAIDKAKAVGHEIGYPENLDNDNLTNLEKYYAGYNFNSSFMENTLLVLKLAVKVNLRSIREPVNRRSWSEVPPTIINAFYDPSRNHILFPAGILQTPYFNKDAPKYLNYGAIGMVMGHEMTHGFDDLGRQYDKIGNKIPWWTNETIEAFNNRTKCIIDQYSNYTVAQANDHIRGQQTQGEDIADNGGLKQAFYAYQKWSQNHKNIDKHLPGLTKYTAEQMFFISFGYMWCDKQTDQAAKNQVLLDVHSPARFRVIGATSNFDEFDRAFGCTPGRGSSRVHKCTVW